MIELPAIPLPPESVYSRRVLYMVQRLHERGYERLRIAPGWSASGVSWRCALASADDISHQHGAQLDNPRSAQPEYTSEMRTAYFGWTDADAGDPDALADR